MRTGWMNPKPMSYAPPEHAQLRAPVRGHRQGILRTRRDDARVTPFRWEMSGATSSRAMRKTEPGHLVRDLLQGPRDLRGRRAPPLPRYHRTMRSWSTATITRSPSRLSKKPSSRRPRNEDRHRFNIALDRFHQGRGSQNAASSCAWREQEDDVQLHGEAKKERRPCAYSPPFTVSAAFSAKAQLAFGVGMANKKRQVALIEKFSDDDRKASAARNASSTFPAPSRGWSVNTTSTTRLDRPISSRWCARPKNRHEILKPQIEAKIATAELNPRTG